MEPYACIYSSFQDTLQKIRERKNRKRPTNQIHNNNNNKTKIPILNLTWTCLARLIEYIKFVKILILCNI